jgi:hypothetical protein
MNDTGMQKKITENDILASLESAISSYNTRDFESIAKQSLAKAKSPRRRKLAVREIETPIGLAKEISENLIEKAKQLSNEAHMIEDIISAEIISEEKEIGIKKQVKKKVEKVKRQVSRSRKGEGRRMIRRQLEKINFITPVAKLVHGFGSKYHRQLFTVSLSVAMLVFVGFSTYITYAYVAGGSDLVEKVGNHVILPAGETPKVYIVQSERSEIFQNPLFKGIQVGDNVLSYSNAKKVIIYRGSEDRVVNIVDTTQ